MPIKGASGGAAALDDLLDVILTAPTKNDLLQFNGTNWVNQNFLLFGNNASTATPVANRGLEIRQLWTNNVIQASMSYVGQTFAGAPSGNWRGLQLSLTGTLGYTNPGTANEYSGMFFVCSATLPSGCGITTCRGTVFQNSMQETAGSTAGIANNYGVVGISLGTTNGTAHIGTVIAGVAGQVKIRSKSVDIACGVRAEVGAGNPGAGVAQIYSAFDIDPGFGGGEASNIWAALHCPVITGANGATNKRGLYILQDFANELAGKTRVAGTGLPIHGLDSQQSLGVKTTANKVAAYNAAEETVIPCDATTAAFAVNLPTAVGIRGRVYIIKKVDVTANAVTVTPNGAETIDGAATVVLNAQWQVTRIVSDNANWLII